MKHISQLPTFKCLPFLFVAALLGGTMAGAATTNETTHSQAMPAPEAKEEWKVPEKVLPQVSYDGLPLVVVVNDLRQKFENAFDILLPRSPSGEETSGDIPVALRLQNVNAGEVFHAMNLFFEVSKSGVRWELTMNGHRPTALLHRLDAPKPPVDMAGLPVDPTTGLPMAPTIPQKAMVYFVGDLVGDVRSGGMSMEQITQTVGEMCKVANANIVVGSHVPAQLIVVRGSEEDIVFVRNTLSAMRDKVQLDARRQAAARGEESKAKTNETKAR